MFGLGMWEILVILVVALIFIGPQKLPEIARSLGKGMREFRGAADQLRSSIEEPVEQVTRPLKDAILHPEASVKADEPEPTSQMTPNGADADTVLDDTVADDTVVDDTVPDYHVPAENGDNAPESQAKPKGD